MPIKSAIFGLKKHPREDLLNGEFLRGFYHYAALLKAVGVGRLRPIAKLILPADGAKKKGLLKDDFYDDFAFNVKKVSYLFTKYVKNGKKYVKNGRKQTKNPRSVIDTGA